MPTASRHPDTALAVFLAFLKLGCSAFGGPIAHLGYFRDEFVRRRGWLSESSYADLVALCQFLPGPASSQVGMALGLARAGYPGALAAWLGFTLPSALLLVLFALGLGRWGALLPEGVLHGLKIAAVAVVAQAVWGMGRSLCPDRPRLTLMALSCASVLAWPTAWTQVAVIAGAGLAGRALLKTEAVEGHERLPIAIGYRGALLFLTLFAVLLVCLPLAARLWPEQWLRLLDAFYRAGSLVFGGGHVVLPLLQAEVVPKGWVDGDTFLAGYAAAQAVPGPLFTFAAFLGAASGPAPNGWSGALLCLLAIFLPSFLLVAGALPFWERLRHERRVRATLAGVNAAGRPAAGRAVPAALDRRHPAPGRLRPAALRPAGPARLEDAALASGARLRRGRRPDRHSRLAVQGQAQPLRRRRGRLARLRALRPVAEAQAAPVLAVDEDRHRKIVHQLAGVTGVGL
ncbi:putative chromate transport protein [Pseudomonas aeruginosa]|nr:putative chromate transport protein [Pseudomonas aeruginosa]